MPRYASVGQQGFKLSIFQAGEPTGLSERQDVPLVQRYGQLLADLWLQFTGRDAERRPHVIRDV